MLVAAIEPFEFLVPSTMTVSPGSRSLTGADELIVTFVAADVETWTMPPVEVWTYTMFPSTSLMVPNVPPPPNSPVAPRPAKPDDDDVAPAPALEAAPAPAPANALNAEAAEPPVELPKCSPTKMPPRTPRPATTTIVRVRVSEGRLDLRSTGQRHREISVGEGRGQQVHRVHHRGGHGFGPVEALRVGL